tara:strand:+ start:4703 stop:4987 length:285 start_codon:yes stop_codon:yes gene_type:complete
MKKLFSCIFRLIISYGKFGVVVFTLALFKNVAISDLNTSLSTTSLKYLGFNNFYIGEQQNIRRINFCPKNFLNVDKKNNLNPLNINHKQIRRKV